MPDRVLPSSASQPFGRNLEAKEPPSKQSRIKYGQHFGQRTEICKKIIRCTKPAPIPSAGFGPGGSRIAGSANPPALLEAETGQTSGTIRVGHKSIFPGAVHFLPVSHLAHRQPMRDSRTKRSNNRLVLETSLAARRSAFDKGGSLDVGGLELLNPERFRGWILGVGAWSF